MDGMRRRFWKAASLAVVGGTVAAGGWLGFAQAESLPDPQTKGTPAAKPEPVVPWVRAASLPPADAPAEKVEPAAGKFPAIPIPATSDATVIPAGAKVTTPATAMPTMPVVAQPPTPLPTMPPLPGGSDFKALPVPAVPGNIDPIPSPAPVVPTVPKMDEPLKPVIPPPAVVTPPAPPANSADPAKPMLPVQTDLNLRPMIGGNTVKPDEPVKTVVPSVPLSNPVPTSPLPIPTVPTTQVPAVPTGLGDPAVPAIPGSRSKPMEAPIAPTEKYVFPVPAPMATIPNTLGAPAYTQPTTPGVPPMLNNPTVMAALTGIALAFGPNAQADDPKPADAAQLKRDLDEANRKLTIAQKDIDALSTLLYGRKGPDGKPLEYDLGALEEVKRLKDRVRALESTVEGMKGNSTSLRPGNLPAAIGKGTVRVVNEYPVPVSIIINEKNYRVEPSTTLNVDIPAGDFSYQLLQSGAAATKSTIKEKEVVTLRVK